MQFRQLNCFIQVAKLKSFSRAATVLNISQPALSKQIKALEEDLSVQLLHRTTRGVSLTSAGEHLLEHGETLLQQVQVLRDGVSASAQNPHGVVRVGFPPSLAKVARALMDLCQQQFPQVQLQLLEGLSIFLEEWLLMGRIDLAIMSGSQFRDGFQLVNIGEEEFYLVGHKTSLWAERERITLEEVSRLGLVTTRGFRNTIDQATKASGVTLTYQFEVDSISLLRELVCEARFATLLPAIVIQQGGFEDLAILEVTDPKVTRRIVLATNPVSHANFAHRSVRAMLKEELKRQLTSEMSRRR